MNSMALRISFVAVMTLAGVTVLPGVAHARTCSTTANEPYLAGSVTIYGDAGDYCDTPGAHAVSPALQRHTVFDGWVYVGDWGMAAGQSNNVETTGDLATSAIAPCTTNGDYRTEAIAFSVPAANRRDVSFFKVFECTPLHLGDLIPPGI
jgi:hypothetical protein